MPLDAGDTFLHHPAPTHLGVWRDPSEAGGNHQLDFDTSALRGTARVMAIRIVQPGVVGHRGVQQIGKRADLTDALIRESWALGSEVAEPPAGGRNGSVE